MGLFLTLFANFYCYFITYATYWVLVYGVSNIDGWDFSVLSILYGLSLSTYSISGTFIWYTVYHLDEIITNGNLDLYITRPLGVLRQMVFQRFGDTFLGQMAVTIIFLVSAFAAKMEQMLALLFFYLLLCICGGVMIQAGGFPKIAKIHCKHYHKVIFLNMNGKRAQGMIGGCYQ